MQLNIVTIGYAKHALNKDSREHARMAAYAQRLTSLHVIVFTRKREGLPACVHASNLTVYGTHSSTAIGMLIDAVCIASRLLAPKRDGAWIISSQDPFETSLVGKLVSWWRKVPHHVQLHGDNFGATTWLRESVLNHLRYFFGLYVLRSASQIRVVSQRIERSLITKGVPADRITVLPIRPELEKFLALHRTYAPKEYVTFLFLGRFAPEKNIDQIVRAFAQVKQLNENVQLICMGSGAGEQAIRSLIEKLELQSFVTIVPWSNDVVAQMEKADVLLLASKHEAYALVLVEAMAAGMPVVTTDVGCVGEIVRHGEQGRVVYEHTDEAYAEAMYFFVRDHEAIASYGKRGRETAQKIAATSMESYIDEWIHSVAKSLSGV